MDARTTCEDVHLALDIRRKLPFKTGQISGIFAEHVLEHLDQREDMPKTLSECYRILCPGGVMRIIVPDTERFLRAYVLEDPVLWDQLGWARLPEDMPTPMHMINHIFHQNGEHLFGYDFASLQLVLRQAGFASITRQSFGSSLDPRLAIDRSEHRAYSLYVDARKPALAQKTGDADRSLPAS
ncbi:MAG: methyltransferase domain-containing protein [Magnetococcales bacterium]|nr:methyltransferase domain-containing protein [Magnetococcales bacterium]MBF0321328.1 methyltransferase domain-containing protein [Magnetococcales bacterium]